MLFATTIALACLFAASYTIGLGRPSLNSVLVALVSPAGHLTNLSADLERGTGYGITFRSYATERNALGAVANQQVYAALIVGPTSGQLLVSSVSGPAIAHALEQVSEQLPATKVGPLLVRDIRPLPSGDPQGFVIAYVLFCTMLLGFVSTFVIRVNVPELSLREWLMLLPINALAGGLATALVVGPITGGLRGSLPELWLALAAWIAICALFARTALVLLHAWAVVPTLLTLVIIGIPSSGAVVARPLLPEFYRAVGPWLPDGATAQLLRNIGYFPDNQHLEPLLVLTVWLIALLVALVFLKRHLSTHAPSVDELIGDLPLLSVRA